MQEQRVSYNTAVLAKEKGFDIVVSEWYDETGVLIDETSDDHVECMYANGDILCFRNGDIPNISTAPTQSLLQRWLREVHSKDVIVLPYDNVPINYKSHIYTHLPGNRLSRSVLDPYPTHEKALEQGLYEALSLLPSKYDNQ